MQIIEEHEYTLKIQKIRVTDKTVVTVVRGVSGHGDRARSLRTCVVHASDDVCALLHT